MKACTKLRLCFSLLGPLSGMAACAPSPSPLYVSNKVSGTIGEIPRDTRGEPIWSHIRQPLQAPPPPAFSTAPSLPVIPPQQN